MQVICRHAKDDFEALMTAQGMEDAGAFVFSVVWTGRNGTMLAYAVFAKYDAPTTPEVIDDRINRRLFPDEVPNALVQPEAKAERRSASAGTEG